MNKKSNAAPKRKEIFVRIDRCVACKTCEIQCALKRSSLSQRLPEAIYEAVSPMPRLQVQPIGDHGSLPIQCRHCEDAPCLDACPSGALQREKDGLVVMQGGKCIGCWMCLMVCPFGAIKPFREFRKAIKCDSCLGMEEPYCIAHCPTGALVFMAKEEFLKEYGKDFKKQIFNQLLMNS